MTDFDQEQIRRRNEAALRFHMGQRVKFRHARFGDQWVTGKAVEIRMTPSGASLVIHYKGTDFVIPSTAVR